MLSGYLSFLFVFDALKTYMNNIKILKKKRKEKEKKEKMRDYVLYTTVYSFPSSLLFSQETKNKQKKRKEKKCSSTRQTLSSHQHHHHHHHLRSMIERF